MEVDLSKVNSGSLQEVKTFLHVDSYRTGRGNDRIALDTASKRLSFKDQNHET